MGQTRRNDFIDDLRWNRSGLYPGEMSVAFRCEAATSATTTYMIESQKRIRKFNQAA